MSETTRPASSDGWFARNTHRWDDWTMSQLLEAKAQATSPPTATPTAPPTATPTAQTTPHPTAHPTPQAPPHPRTPPEGESTGRDGAGGIRISLVVPARNEAATVGTLVERVRKELVERHPLLDEVVVIDSDSVDDTGRVAAEAGATVHRSSEIRPDLGSVPGKGEALWKSLFVTHGDVMVFMDADLVDWDTHFVPGLLGPLLTDPTVQVVKGFYGRPFTGTTRQGDAPATGETAGQGGRVTELVARPLFALLFPELAGIVQPLAGEWAVRRETFAGLSVPTGYGVELAALVDTVRASGLDAIAQVGLGRRTHHHQDLRDLGAMATQLLAAALHRSHADAEAAEVVLRQFVADPADPTAPGTPTSRTVRVDERPPARTVGALA